MDIGDGCVADKTRTLFDFDALPDGIVIVRADLTVIAVNDAAEFVFGISREQIQSMAFTDLFPESFQSEVSRWCERQLVDPQPDRLPFEGWAVRADGTEFAVEMNCRARHTATGNVAVVAVRDVTERKLLEVKFASLLDAAPDGMVIIDEEGTIELVNQQTERMFGVSRAALIGRPVEQLVPVRLRESHLAHRQSYCRKPSVRWMGMGQGLYALHADGHEFPVEISLSPMHFGQRMLVIAAIRDVTERKLLEAAVQQRDRLASLGTLTASIAHEINNPVGAALLIAENARSVHGRPEQDGFVAECLDQIVSAMQRCGHIVRDLLRFSRSDAVERVPIDLNETVRKSADLIRGFAESRGTRTRLRLEAGLRPVLASPLEMELVFVNLLRNSVEACSGGGQVVIETISREQFALFRVSDTGEGMTDEMLKHVFDPFYTGKESSGGTGLGMSIVYGIVQEHDGTIDVESTIDVGTTVTVQLPYAK